METVARRISDPSAWTYLGGDEGSKEAPECIVRAFDGPVRFTTGSTAESADPAAAVHVPRGEGRRLVGRHFFAQPAEPASSCLIAVRGI